MPLTEFQALAITTFKYYHSRNFRIMQEQTEAQQVAVSKIKGTRINRMVMEGFKSFAKHTEFLFNGDYNCVIGPNGSGKSNVLDALCFVLGKSSSKSLRAEKSANLIYNGGKAKKPAKQGEVCIYFDNMQKIFPTEDKEVKISRIVRHNGQSIYKINDEARTRQEVLDLLSIARINPDGYNIVLQGDIIKLVEMQPNERRELISEVAGISVYEDKKEKALRELGKVDERLKETGIVLTERFTYLKDLKKDRDQALKYKDMNDKIRVNQASYLKVQMDRKLVEKQEAEQKIAKEKEDLEKLNSKIAAFKEKNLSLRQDIEYITREIEEQGEIEQVKLNKEVEALKIDVTRKQARIDTVQYELAKLEQRKLDLELSQVEMRGKIKQLEDEKKSLQYEIIDKEKDRVHISAKLAEFKKKNNLDNAGQIESQIEEIDKKIEELQKEVNQAREQQHHLIREKDKVQHELNTLFAELEKQNLVEDEHKKQLNDLQKKRQDFKDCTLELNKKLDEDTFNAAKLSEQRKRYNSLQEDVSKLRARHVSAQELSYGDIAIKRILELKKTKPEIYGTVAELGNVNSRYALALEIAAGPKIKSIVVEDDRIAAECIQYLKDQKLGVVTFLPLNKLRPNSVSAEVKKIIGAKGSHGLAIELVTFEGRFKNVFEHVLADTVIVDTIDVARRLGIGTAKFVTLEGDMAEKSGAMIGGYRIKRKQSMGFQEKDIAEEIEAQETMLISVKNSVSGLESKRIDDEERISHLRVMKAQLEGEIISLEKALHLDRSSMGESTSKKQHLENVLKDVDQRMMLMQDKVSSLNKELALGKSEKEKLRQNISHLRNPTVLAELNAFEQKLREINEHVIIVDGKMKVLDSQSEGVFKNELNRTQLILKQLDREYEQFKEELSDVQRILKDKDKELKIKEDKAKEFYAKFKNMFQKRSEIDKLMQVNDNEISKVLDASRATEIKLNTYSLKFAEISAAFAGLEMEFSQYEGVLLDLEKTEDELKNDIRKFEKMRELIGSVNMRALEIYDDVEKQFNQLNEKKEQLGIEKEDVMKLMQEIEGKKKELFMRTYLVINENFQNFFTKLTTKGAQATLVLENEEDPFDAGVRINVKISGSKFLDIRSLSGGEKTMTALAFIFSIQEYEPASFYVLDEVDAALDKHNSEKLGKLVHEYSQKAQYVVISHNDAVITEADTLYGVSMNEHGMSQVISLKI